RAPPPDSTNPTRTTNIRSVSRARDRAQPKLRVAARCPGSAGRRQPEPRYARSGPGAKLWSGGHPPDARDEPLEQIVGGGHLRGKRGTKPFHERVGRRIWVRIEGGHDPLVSKIGARPGPRSYDGFPRVSGPGCMNDWTRCMSDWTRCGRAFTV